MIPVKVLAARVLPNAPNALLGALDTEYPCLALLTAWRVISAMCHR